jgi:hypothetical protein
MELSPERGLLSLGKFDRLSCKLLRRLQACVGAKLGYSVSNIECDLPGKGGCHP